MWWKKIMYLQTLILFTLLGCTNQSEEELFPENFKNNNCDTSSISFNTTIKPIIENNCIICHSTQQPVLKTYNDISVNATRILGAIKHTPGYSPMPQGSQKLSDCQILQFEKWINIGKPNN